MRTDGRTNATLWIDITELFGQFSLASHPTGVSRVIINLTDALAAERGAVFAKVKPIFWHPVLQSPLAVDEPGLGPLEIFFPALRTQYASSGWTVPTVRSGVWKGIRTAIPKPFRFRIFPYLHGVTHFAGWARQAGLRVSPVEFAPGDCLFVPGSFWLDRYAPRLGALARSKGAAVVAFAHDVLLLSHPEWMAPHHSQQFRRGLESFLPCCTAIICNSAYTRDELRKHFSLTGGMSTAVCRLADIPKFMHSPKSMTNMRAPADVAKLLGQRYALLVSTFLFRKNHGLAVSAWQKLWHTLHEATPWLVMVGGGTPDPVLAEMLTHEGSFGGRIIRLGGLDDAVLETLYANAWITVYPSLDEGYGLPVAEALARGKVCLAARRGGLTEVAPDLVDAIDAEEPDDLARRVVEYLANPALLSAKEELIRRRYRPTHWEETARTVRGVLESAVAGSGGTLSAV